MVNANFNYKKIEYPSGEFGIEIQENIENMFTFKLYWIVDNKNVWKEILQIQMLLNYIKENNNAGEDLNIILISDFIPLLRDDRDQGGHINSFAFMVNEVFKNATRIVCLDFHSHEMYLKNYGRLEKDYSGTIKELFSGSGILTNKVKMLNINNFTKIVYNEKKDTNNNIVVFPDKSSFAKFYMTSHTNFRNNELLAFIKMQKNRDFDSGKIVSIVIENEIDTIKNIKENYGNGEFNLLLVDDICSFGGTFVGSVKAIKNSFNKNDIKINKVQLLTIYDEGQEKSSDFKENIDEHIFIKSINLK